jgi:transposase
VSWGYAKKIRGQQRRSGRKERPVQQRPGPVSRITAAVQESLREWLRRQPDLTEAELHERLRGQGVPVVQSRVGQVLRAMGLRRKKIAPCGRARQGSQPQAARRISRHHRGHPAGEADLPGRERSHHPNDALVGTSAQG